MVYLLYRLLVIFWSFFITIHKIFNNSYIICRGIHLSKSLTKNSFGLYDNIPPTIRGIHVLIAVHTINIIFFINLCIIPYIYVFNDITLMPNKYHVCNGNFLIKLLSKPLTSNFYKNIWWLFLLSTRQSVRKTIVSNFNS